MREANGTVNTGLTGLLQPFGGKVAVLTWGSNQTACL